MGQHRELTTQQHLFIDAYIAGNNATNAAIIAGYSEDSARSQASRLLSKENIRSEVDRRRGEAAAKLNLSPETVLRRLQVEADGLGPDTNASSRIKAAELLGKHLGMFTDRVEVDSIGPPPVFTLIPARSRDGDC